MSIYDMVGGLKPGRSSFDLSHAKIFDCDIGQLVPVLCQEVLPGDFHEISAAHIIKMQPMVVPVYHRMSVYYHTFFVPMRLLWDKWEKFITGGVNGDLTIALPNVLVDNDFSLDVSIKQYGLWDFFGFPLESATPGSRTFDHPTSVNDFLWRAYWAIWRDYYRDENFQTVFPGTTIECGQDLSDQLIALNDYMAHTHINMDSGYNLWTCDKVGYRCFQKDYFTAATPWQQRGTSPAIPVSGTTSAVWDIGHFYSSTEDEALNGIYSHPEIRNDITGQNLFGLRNDSATGSGAASGKAAKNLQGALNGNHVDFTAVGVDINDLRFAVQTQKWMERNARGGFRYNEQLQTHFGVSPRDERLNRPEYIGGMMQPVITSEVLQTSSTDTESPQGTFAGHGMAVGKDFVGKYHAKEHGIILGIMSIMPEAVYQQGIKRTWRKKTRFDYYSPEFAHLSEQEIALGEIYFQDSSNDENRFGFQGAYDEYRQQNSMVCGKIANELKYWTLSRIFDSAPSLNEAFITTEALSKTRREAWAVPGVTGNLQGEFLVQWRNLHKAMRLMPYIPEPGLLDHF